MAEDGSRSRRREAVRAAARGSGAATFASGLPRGPSGRPPSLRRRIVLLLVPGLLCIALGIGGAAVIDRLDEDDPDLSPAQQCTPSPSRPGPEIDLGIEPAAGTGLDPGLPATYDGLDREAVRRLVARAGEAGASIISTPALWRDLKRRPGAFYDWRLLDRVVDEARSQGMKVRLRVGTLPAFAFDDASLRDASGEPRRWRPPLSEGELDRWSQFLASLTRHVKGRVDYIEIWNEPNRQLYWTTGPDPAAFARLLETSHHTITSLDPSIIVVSGGLRANDVGFLERTYGARDRIFGEGALLFDQVGVHPYSGDRAPALVSEQWVGDRPRLGEVDRNFQGYRALREVMRRHGDGTEKIYISEFGYSTQPREQFEGVPDETRAEYLTEAFETVTCSAGVSALSWYAFHPSPTDPPSWSLLNRPGNAIETYRALRRWAERVGAAG